MFPHQREHYQFSRMAGMARAESLDGLYGSLYLNLEESASPLFNYSFEIFDF